jgi:predicted amidohydrolase
MSLFTFLRIAQAQINPTVGDLRANLNLMDRFLGQARQQGADLATFPEMAICGYPPEDLLLKPHSGQLRRGFERAGLPLP